MIFKVFVEVFLVIVLLACRVASQCQQQYVDIVCSEDNMASYYEHNIGTLRTCRTTSTLSVMDINTQIRDVKYLNETLAPKCLFEAIYIQSAVGLIFLPTGLKKHFPKLTALDVRSSGLIYVDEQDMKPLDSGLLYNELWDNKLIALKNNLFKHNPNLVYIDLR